MRNDNQIGEKPNFVDDAKIESDVLTYADEEQSVEATPAAEKEAKKAKVDVSEVEGTGAGGKVTKADVEKAKK